MAIQDSKEQTQYILGKFITQPEAEMAYNALKEKGFSPEKISLQKEPIDLKRDSKYSQLKKSAKGGAIIGGVFGAIVGLTLSIMTNNIPASATVTFNPYLHPLVGTIIGAIIGASGIGLIGAITGKDIPKTKPNTDGESLAYDYKIILVGTEEEVVQATEILNL